MVQQRAHNEAINNEHQVIVSDISLQMLDCAKKKVANDGVNMMFLQLDAENMIEIETAS